MSAYLWASHVYGPVQSDKSLILASANSSRKVCADSELQLQPRLHHAKNMRQDRALLVSFDKKKAHIGQITNQEFLEH